MSLKEVPMWTVVCDECGADFNEGGEFIAWTDRESAIEVYMDSYEGTEWSEFHGKHRCGEHNPFCTNCGQDAGELSGERDYLCHACFARSNLAESQGEDEG